MAKIPGKGYRAGTAYVAVTPVFGDSQKLISREMQRMINSMSDEEIEKKIADRVARGIEKGYKQGEQSAKKSIDEIGDHVEKSVKDTTKVVDQEIDKRAKKQVTSQKKVMNDYRREMKAAVTEIGSHMDDIHNRFGRRGFRGRNGLAAPFREAKKALDELNEEIAKGAKSSESKLGKNYDELARGIEKMRTVIDSRGNRGDKRALQDITDAFKHYNAVLKDGLTSAQAKEMRAAEAQRIKDAKDAAAARKKIADKEVADAEAAQKQLLKDQKAAQAKRERAQEKQLAHDRRVDLENQKAANKRIAEAAAAQRQMAAAELYAQRRADALADRAYREERERNKKLEAEERRTQRELNKIQEQANRRRRAEADRDRKYRLQQQAAERAANLQSIEDAADASARARVGSMRNLGQEKAGDNRRQRRLIEAHDRVLQRLQDRISATMAALSKLSSQRTRVALVTTDAEKNLYALNRRLDAFSKLDIDKEVDVSINEADLAKEIARTRKYVESIPDVELDIDLHDTEAQTKLNNLRAEIARIQDLEIGADLSAEDLNEIRARLARLTSEVREIDVDVADEEAIVAIRRLEIALDTIKDKKVGIDIRETDARAQIAEIEAMLAELDRKQVDIPIDLEVRKSMIDRLQQFNGEVRRGDNYMRSLNTSIKNASISLTETTQAFRIFSPVMAGVVFAGAPLVSLLGNVTAGVGALTSALPGLAGGFSVLGFAFGGLGDAMDEYDKAQEALLVAEDERTKAQQKHIDTWNDKADAVGEATVSFIEYMDELKGQVSGLQMLAREGLFPGVESGMRRLLNQYMGPFGDFLNRMGEGFGTFADHWSRLLTSPSAQEWFGRVGRDANVYSGHLLIASENFAAGLAHIVDAFRPAMRSIMTWIVDASEGFERWSDSLTVNQTWLDFMKTARNTMPMINELVGNLGELFINLTIAVEPFTEAVLDALNAGLDFLNAMDPKMLSGLLGVVGGLTGGLMILSGVMAGVGAAAAIIKAAAGSALTGVASALAGFVVASSAALGASVALEGEVSPLMESFLNLGETLYIVRDASAHVMGLLGDLFDAISPLLPAVFDMAENVMTLGAALVDSLAGGAGVVIDILGGLVDLFTMMPEWAQQAALGILVFAASFGKVKSGVETAMLYGLEFLDWGKELIKGFKDSGGALLDFADGIGMAVVGGLDAVGITDNLGGKLARMSENASLAGGAARTLTGTLVGLGAAAAGITVLTLAISALADAQEKAKEATEAAGTALESSLKGVQDAGGDLNASLDEFFTDRNRWTGGPEGLADAVRILNVEMNGSQSAVNSMGSAINKANARTEEFDSTLASMINDGNMAGALAAYGNFAQAALDAGWSQEQLAEKLPSVSEEFLNINRELGEVVSETELLAALNEGRLPEALISAMEANGNYKDEMAALKGETSGAAQATRDLIAASDELAGRYLSQEEANLRYQETLSEFNEKMKNAKQTLDETTEAGQNNRRAMLEMADATKAKAEADLEATGDADAYIDTLWNQRETFRKLAKQMGLNDEQAEIYANTLMEIPLDVNSKVDLKNDRATKAKIQEVIDELDGFKDKTVSLTVMARRSGDGAAWDLLLGDKSKPGKTPGPWAPEHGGYKFNRRGGILDFYAEGGLRPMDPIAQMVAPNTWRVVGDRMDVPEAYVPLDGSPRSKKILFQALMQMPGMFMHDGGIVNFAAGAVAAPDAPAVDGEKVAEGGDMGKVSEAFLALSAALRDGFSVLFADLYAQAQEFFANILGETDAFEASAIASALEFQALTLANETAYREASLAGERAMLESLTGQHASHRSREGAAQRDFLANMLAMAQTHSQNEVGLARSTAATLEGILRAHHSTQVGESARMHDDLLGVIRDFGARADTEWSRIWRGLVSSAKGIFSQLPGEIGSILSATSGKLNKHIVDPFNKIIKDLDLKKLGRISPFPTQSHATGGHIALRSGGFMPGYTPGRDVHTFYSDTGGILELSGGEPVLRPEAGLVLGREWVDGVNMAARTGGVRGVRDFLMPRQALASGGMVWPNLWGIVHEQFPAARLTSAKRNGRGGSYHNVGKAVDVAGPRPGDTEYMYRIFKFLHDNYGNSAELIFTHPKSRGKNILNGAYHNYSPAVVADHRDHVHWANRVRFSDVVGPPTGGSAMGVYDIAGGVKQWVAEARKNISDTLIPQVQLGAAEAVFGAIAKEKADAFITDHAYTDPGSPGGGVARWASMVGMALDHVGQPNTDIMRRIVLRRMNQESGGNPRAINLWDSNARRGTPSKGLMQVIDPTFRAYRDRSLVNDIWDPMANIVASMRYALGVYGSLPAAYNRRGGYALGTAGIDLNSILGVSAPLSPSANSIKPLLRDRGGAVPRGLSLVQNSLSHEETIIPHTPAEVEAMFDRAHAGASIDNSTNFPNAHFHTDPRETAAEIDRIKRVAAIQRPIKF